MTYRRIAQITRIPLSTVTGLRYGTNRNPRYDNAAKLLALREVFRNRRIPQHVYGLSPTDMIKTHAADYLINDTLVSKEE